MERNNKLEKIIRENSLMSPSANFTESVLNKISVAPINSSYKPLIGKRAGYIVISLIALFFLGAIFSSIYGVSEPLVNLPDWNITLPEFTLRIPPTVLAGVLAVFILVLTDAGFRRSRF